MDSTAAPRPDLSARREQVLTLAAAPTAAARRPVVRARSPLRTLPPDVVAKLAADVHRSAAPVDPKRLVIPGALFAAVDALAVVLAAARGSVLLAVIAGVLFVPFALIVVGGIRYRPRGPLPLRPAEQRAVDDACCWQSPHDWSGTLAGCPELALVTVAADAAQRVADNPRYVEQSSRPDLGASLDEIDELAHQAGLARLDASVDPEVKVPAWDAAVERVATMIAYADLLEEGA